MSMLTRRYMLVQMLSAAPLLAMGCRHGIRPKNAKLRVGSTMQLEPMLLKQVGLTAEQLNIEFINFSGGNLVLKAINAEALDAGGISQIPAAFAIVEHANLKIIGILRGDINSPVLLVPKDSTAHTFKDLRGKRIAYIQGTTSHYILLKLLARNQMTLHDVDAINLSPSDGQAAFTAGKLDGWIIYGYPGLIVQNRYGARVLTNAQGILTGDYLFAVRKDLIDNINVHHQIENYLIANQKAFAWRASHPQEFANLYAKVIGIPAEIILQSIKHESQPYQFARLNQEVINDTAEVIKAFANAGLLTEVSDISSAFDFSFQNILCA